MNTEWQSGWSLALAAGAIAFCIYTFYRNSLWILYGSYDTGWLIQTGLYMLQHGIPSHDVFSWSNPDCQYTAYQWLFMTLMAILFQYGSLWLVGFFACLLTGLLIFFFLPRMWIARGIPVFVPFLFLALVQTPQWFNARPQLSSYFLILIFIGVLERYRTNAGKTFWLAVLPPLMIIWANLHSFWCIGLLTMLIYLICDIQRRQRFPLFLFGSFLLSTLAVFLNPYDIGLVSYLWTFFDSSQYLKIWELMPWFSSMELAWTILYLPVAWWSLLTFKQKVPLEGFILSSIFTALALMMRRFEPLIVIISWNYLGLALAAIDWSKYRYRPPAISFKLFAPISQLVQLAGALAISVITWYSQFPSLMSAWMIYTEDSWPLLAIVEKLTADKDKLFSTPQLGSWLIAMGGSPVFVDTRFDMYPKSFIESVNNCLEGKEEWATELDSWGIREIVCADDLVLNQRLLSSPDWTMVLDDGKFDWWVRNSDACQQKLQTWHLSDEQLGNSGLPKHILTATIETRAVKYLRLSRIYLKQKQPALAMDAVNRGLRFMPQSRALGQQRQLCSAAMSNEIPR